MVISRNILFGTLGIFCGYSIFCALAHSLFQLRWSVSRSNFEFSWDLGIFQLSASPLVCEDSDIAIFGVHIVLWSYDSWFIFDACAWI